MKMPTVTSKKFEAAKAARLTSEASVQNSKKGWAIVSEKTTKVARILTSSKMAEGKAEKLKETLAQVAERVKVHPNDVALRKYYETLKRAVK